MITTPQAGVINNIINNMIDQKITVTTFSNRRLRRLAALQNKQKMIPSSNDPKLAYTVDRKTARKKGLLKINSLDL